MAIPIAGTTTAAIRMYWTNMLVMDFPLPASRGTNATNAQSSAKAASPDSKKDNAASIMEPYRKCREYGRASVA